MDAEAIRAVGRDADFVRSVLVVAKAYSTMPHAGTLFRSQEAAQMALFAVALRAAGNPLCSGQQQALDRLERLGASALNHRDGCLDGPRAREVLEAGREPLLVHAVKGVARACKKLRAQFLLHGRAPVQEMLWAAGLHAAGEMLLQRARLRCDSVILTRSEIDVPSWHCVAGWPCRWCPAGAAVRTMHHASVHRCR